MLPLEQLRCWKDEDLRRMKLEFPPAPIVPSLGVV
jgi:hypothetical protein